jgi:hypothetical protein
MCNEVAPFYVNENMGTEPDIILRQGVRKLREFTDANLKALHLPLLLYMLNYVAV